MGLKKRNKQKAERQQSKQGQQPSSKEAVANPSGQERSPDVATPSAKSLKAQEIDSDSISLAPTCSARGKSGLTWPRKSGPSTKVARETILAEPSKNGTRTADFSRFEHKRLEAPIALSDGRPSAMNIGKAQETLPVMSGDAPADTKIEDPRSAEDNAGAALKSGSTERMDDVPPEVPTVPPEPGEGQPANLTGWLGWLGYSAVPQSVGSEEPKYSMTEVIPAAEQEDRADISVDPVALKTQDEVPPTEQKSEPKPVPASSGSWFGLWPAAVTATVAEASVTEDADNITPLVDNTESTLPNPNTLIEDSKVSAPLAPAKGSGWAFWSKQPSSSTDKSNNRGELAVGGQASQDQPQSAHTATTKVESSNATPEPSLKMVKKQKSTSTSAGLLGDMENVKKSESPALVGTSTPTSVAPSKATQPNLLLPPLRNTYHAKEIPSFLNQITRLLLHSPQVAPDQLFLSKEPPRIKKALAIGIHGLFPAQFLRTVIGQPTGTSIRFANHAAAAIQKWTESHGMQCEIEKVALEGEGKIGERVDSLWKLLLNWVDHVRQSDFILIACHSQGVPVAMMLIGKLLEFGVVSSAKIGVCAMAGVSLGPFVEYKANVRFFGGSTAELFEFADPNSEVSKRYEQSLEKALSYGVKITFVGSIDDQLVSLESAIFSPANHPHIYRAVFVDGRVHAPDFIAHLVGFALKLRNLGVTDHGLIRELSAPLAGSLYTGGGHSSLYHETEIYDLAIAFALETSTVANVPLNMQRPALSLANNPFQLPWSMRGVLEEDVVKTSLDSEAKELLEQFDEWKPATKGLKDVKYRLEAVRSKL